MAENVSGNGSGFLGEVAHRIFAAEFKESNLHAKEGQDQYSPSYLITPTGAKCNRVFIVDPTGAFFVNAGGNTTTKEGNVLTSIRAESMQIVDAATRDRWVVDAV